METLLLQEVYNTPGINLKPSTAHHHNTVGVVERFNRTLTDELLNAVIPLNEQHLNRLLREFKQFYNTARPHRANSGEAPAPLDACNDERFEQSAWQIESTAWLGGLR